MDPLISGLMSTHVSAMQEGGLQKAVGICVDSTASTT